MLLLKLKPAHGFGYKSLMSSLLFVRSFETSTLFSPYFQSLILYCLLLYIRLIMKLSSVLCLLAAPLIVAAAIAETADTPGNKGEKRPANKNNKNSHPNPPAKTDNRNNQPKQPNRDDKDNKNNHPKQPQANRDKERERQERERRERENRNNQPKQPNRDTNKDREERERRERERHERERRERERNDRDGRNNNRPANGNNGNNGNRGTWRYSINGSVVGSGSGNHGCTTRHLAPGQEWRWDAGGSGCQLKMYGDTSCRRDAGLYFQTRGNQDGGPAQTRHEAWNVVC